MSDTWGYCSPCELWLYSYAHPVPSNESPSPVCACPAARMVDRSHAVQVRG